jgi:pimeloyl-ACP methyl ester carboxylesterase
MDAPKSLEPVEGFSVQHVRIHGEEVAYRRGGRGPVLLLLHGIAGSSGTWLAVMRLLKDDYTVLAPDFLGHGKSAKPLGDYSLGNHASGIRDFLHMLDIERVTVVGQSFGGGVALQFAYQFPELCERPRGELAAAPHHPAGSRVRDAGPVPEVRTRLGGPGR